MKIFIQVMCFIFISSLAFASGKENNFVENFRKVKTFSATFTQQNYYPGLDNYTVKGKVYIIKGEKALWDYPESGEYYLLKPTSVEHYSKDLNQLLKVKVNLKDLNDPNAVLLSVFFNSDIIPSTFQIKAEKGIVILTPHNIPQLKYIKIYENKNIIKRVSALDNDGNTIDIEFSNIEIDKNISSGIFIRNIPKGTKIIEQ